MYPYSFSLSEITDSNHPNHSGRSHHRSQCFAAPYLRCLTRAITRITLIDQVPMRNFFPFSLLNDAQKIDTILTLERVSISCGEVSRAPRVMRVMRVIGVIMIIRMSQNVVFRT